MTLSWGGTLHTTKLTLQPLQSLRDDQASTNRSSAEYNETLPTVSRESKSPVATDHNGRVV